MIGIIGGSGLYNLECLQGATLRPTFTPFGVPSAPVAVTEVNGAQVCFIPRHGVNHEHPPHKINYRANIYALKMMGCKQLVTVSAVGSLTPSYEPGMLVTPDQFIDKTFKRESTFFDEIAVHAHFGQPTCALLRKRVANALAHSDVGQYHTTGTYVCMEGPVFSTKAESQLHAFNHEAELIGMTAMPEAKLAREAQMCYANISLVTDFDAWKDEHVTVDQIIATVKSNVAKANKVLERYINRPYTLGCECHTSLKGAVMTNLENIDPAVMEKLQLLLPS